MSSKKMKKAGLPRNCVITKGFKKDWLRLHHSGRYNLNDLKKVMMLLVANDGPLPPEYHDHALIGDWEGFRDCHIGGDFLLIYRIEGDEVIFSAAGTHSELFGR